MPASVYPGTTGPAVSFSDLTTVVDDIPVLFRFGLELRPGSITVLMGQAGAGKTTLVRHLAGLHSPDSGVVAIGGVDLHAADAETLRELRRGMSLMFGGSMTYDTTVFGSMTVLENVTCALEGRGLSLSQVDRVALRRLREMGLHDRAGSLPGDLSAHARKRLALARALAVEAPVLVLDEIETGIDAVHAGAVVAAVQDYHTRTRATVLVTTHDLALARELADVVVIVHHGRIVASGPPSELLKGIPDNETFRLRFLTADLGGPPDLVTVRAEVDRRRQRQRTIELDLRLVVPTLLVIGIVTSYCLFLLLTG
ncbi:Molybdenum transport ATP-binding protein ModC [Pseudonocardia sp. Ae707_Ps1]|nr:Molybdenum transport ATP-binding protein ModC [Pseudonocardia sp. Ae707_Ps1]